MLPWRRVAQMSAADTRGQVVLDVNASEVDDLAAKGRRGARRGRRPKTDAASG